MTDVTIRELRNNGGEVVDRAARGEPITITRSGQPVARLTPVRPPLSAGALHERWKRLPAIDPAALRADVDEVVDTSLFPEPQT
jgi:prevent-host-death family protein